MEYRCVATSVDGFVQQLAVAYVTHGYWFYVAGEIPEHKDPAEVDRKLIQRYGIAISKWARARRKRQGLANMQHLRHERTFVLLATKGRHEFFQRERGTIRDIRRVPIKFGVYSIGCRKGRDGRWHASVRIGSDHFRNLKSYVVHEALHGQAACVARQVLMLSFARYAPVRRQLLSVIHCANRALKMASMQPIEVSAFVARREIVRPFGHVAEVFSS